MLEHCIASRFGGVVGLAALRGRRAALVRCKYKPTQRRRRERAVVTSHGLRKSYMRRDGGGSGGDGGSGDSSGPRPRWHGDDDAKQRGEGGAQLPGLGAAIER